MGRLSRWLCISSWSRIICSISHFSLSFQASFGLLELGLATVRAPTAGETGRKRCQILERLCHSRVRETAAGARFWSG